MSPGIENPICFQPYFCNFWRFQKLSVSYPELVIFNLWVEKKRVCLPHLEHVRRGSVHHFSMILDFPNLDHKIAEVFNFGDCYRKVRSLARFVEFGVSVRNRIDHESVERWGDAKHGEYILVFELRVKESSFDVMASKLWSGKYRDFNFCNLHQSLVSSERIVLWKIDE